MKKEESKKDFQTKSKRYKLKPFLPEEFTPAYLVDQKSKAVGKRKKEDSKEHKQRRLYPHPKDYEHCLHEW